MKITFIHSCIHVFECILVMKPEMKSDGLNWTRQVAKNTYEYFFTELNRHSNFEYFCQSMASWPTFLNVSIQVLKHLYEYKSPKLKIRLPTLPTIEFLQLWCCANLISSNSNKIIKIWKCALYYICILYFYVSDIS